MTEQPTYTFAIGWGMLLAEVPDGQDIDAAVTREWAKITSKCDCGEVPEYEVIRGLVLTNDYPEDDDLLVYASGNSGWIVDENGIEWLYAVHKNHFQRAGKTIALQ